MTDDTSAWNAMMQFSFLRVFANDGIIDADELAMLERMALEDGRVDDRERAVLSNIFARAKPESTTKDVLESIERFKARHQIP